MPVKLLKASSIAEAFRVTVRFLASWVVTDPPLLWFRGVNDCKLSLTPGACWRKNYDETEALITFSQEGAAFHDIGGVNEWNTYYLAQHHGVPTRLLDWSESFSAALFFALDGWQPRRIPCIWILQPSLLNETFLGWHGILAPENIPESNVWLPKQVSKAVTIQDEEGFIYDNEWPLAIYPKKSNLRMHAQQATFTVHGRNASPLDTLLEKKGVNPSDYLARLDLKGCSRRDALRDLFWLGIRRSTIYPDLDNFVKQIKETRW